LQSRTSSRFSSLLAFTSPDVEMQFSQAMLARVGLSELCSGS
jgi:hypothetical protein